MGLFKYLKEKMFGKSVSQKEKYIAGLDKSKRNFSDRLKALTARYNKVDDSYFDELEEILIEADVGVRLSDEILDATKKEAMLRKEDNPTNINEILVDKMFVSYASQGDDIQTEIHFAENGPTVLLVVGVNGVGKTTTIAKLAYRYIKQGKKVLLVAGDTFRAGATEQLTIWAERLNCAIVKGKENQDPASVIYDGMVEGKKTQCDRKRTT